MVLMVFAAGAGEQFASPDGKVRCAFEMRDGHSSALTIQLNDTGAAVL